MLNTNRKKSYNNLDFNKYNNKKTTTKKARKFICTYTIFLIIAGFLMVIYINQSLQIHELNSRIMEMQNNISLIQQNNHEKRLDLARKSSLNRIERIAREQLSMAEPVKSSVVVLRNKQLSETDFPVEEYGKENNFMAFLEDLWDNLNVAMAGSPVQEDKK